MLHKVKLDVADLFIVKKSLNFTGTIRRHNSVNKFEKVLSMVPKRLNTYIKLNHTITKFNQ